MVGGAGVKICRFMIFTQGKTVERCTLASLAELTVVCLDKGWVHQMLCIRTCFQPSVTVHS